MEQGGIAGPRKEWKAKRAPIPIRARDVRERRHGTAADLGGAVESVLPCGNTCPASQSLAQPESKMTNGQQYAAIRDVGSIPAASEQHGSLERFGSSLSSRVLGAPCETSLPVKGVCDSALPAESNHRVTTPRRRNDGQECSEERKRLGFGETPLKQMPEISPLESGKRRAALENSLLSPSIEGGGAQHQPIEDVAPHFDSLPPVKFLEEELRVGESITRKEDVALHAFETRPQEHRSRQKLATRSTSPKSALHQVPHYAQPLKSRATCYSRLPPTRCFQTSSIRRSSPSGSIRCTKGDAGSLRSSSPAACGGA